MDFFFTKNILQINRSYLQILVRSVVELLFIVMVNLLTVQPPQDVNCVTMLLSYFQVKQDKMAKPIPSSFICSFSNIATKLTTGKYFSPKINISLEKVEVKKNSNIYDFYFIKKKPKDITLLYIILIQTFKPSPQPSKTRLINSPCAIEC